jgi:hypothetical protein
VQFPAGAVGFAPTMYPEMGVTYWLEKGEAAMKELQHGS